MQMVYNSDNYVVVQFDGGSAAPGDDSSAEVAPQGRGGYEIVDKFARTEIFIDGALAERFKLGVQALVEQGPTEEKLDEFIAGFTGLAQHRVTLH